MQQPTFLSTVPVTSVLIPFAALLWTIFWGFWIYFRQRKVAELRFQITQLSDFGIPSEFVKELAPHALITISLESTGNKAAEHLNLNITAKNSLEKYEVNPKFPNMHVNIGAANEAVRLSIERLNPSQKLKIFLSCGGDPTENQLSGYEFTHSEGKALPLTAPQVSSSPFANAPFLVFILIVALSMASFVASYPLNRFPKTIPTSVAMIVALVVFITVCVLDIRQRQRPTTYRG